MSLSVETVTRTLDRLTLARTARLTSPHPLLIFQRIFPCASPQAIMRTAQVLFQYIMGLGLNDREVENQRAGEMLRLLFRDERMDADNSRTLLRIVEELVVRIGVYRVDLASVILDTLFKQICASFERTWDSAIRAPAVEITSGSYNLTPLKSTSALFADLYALQFIEPPTFLPILDRILAFVSSPILAKILIYDVMSRACTHTAPKLPATKWNVVLMRWGIAVRENPQADANGRTRTCIEMFIADAESKRQKHSGVPFVEGMDEELDGLCENIREGIVGLGSRAEVERRRVEREHAGLVEVLGGVSLS